MIRKYITKLQDLRYLNRGVVFMSDVLLSTTGTYLSYILILSLNEEWNGEESIIKILALTFIISAILLLATRLYKVIIRHSTFKVLLTIFIFAIVKNVILSSVVFYLLGVFDKWIISSLIIDTLLTVILMVGFRTLLFYAYYELMNISNKKYFNSTLIYSTLGATPMLLDRINKNPFDNNKIKAILTTNSKKDGIYICDTKVKYVGDNYDRVEQIIDNHKIDTVIFSSREHFNKERAKLINILLKKQIKMVIANDMITADKDGNIANNLNKVNIADLLGRDEIDIDIDVNNIAKEVNDKVIFLSGAAGSIGSEIARQIIDLNPKTVILLDIAETPLHNLQLSLSSKIRDRNLNVKFVLGDIRSHSTILNLLKKYNPDIIYHAAAYKHVPMIESNPTEAVLANVWGSVNLANIAIEVGVRKFVMVSTDKAVNPTNVMGASKRIAEICIHYLNENSNTKFIITRFGNVLGSNGSVIPLFESQIANGGPVTVTHPEVVRYFMTIPEACRLVLQAGTMGKGGELFVFDMGDAVRIADMARNMIRLSGLTPDKDIKIEYTGLRPGEKMYEEILSDVENTDITNHKKIRISRSQIIFDDNLVSDIKRLIVFARKQSVDDVINIMSKLVPEFKSENS